MTFGRACEGIRASAPGFYPQVEGLGRRSGTAARDRTVQTHSTHCRGLAGSADDQHTVHAGVDRAVIRVRSPCAKVHFNGCLPVLPIDATDRR